MRACERACVCVSVCVSSCVHRAYIGDEHRCLISSEAGIKLCLEYGFVFDRSQATSRARHTTPRPRAPPSTTTTCECF